MEMVDRKIARTGFQKISMYNIILLVALFRNGFKAEMGVRGRDRLLVT